MNAKGEVSPRRDGSEHHVLQRLLLEKEKVRFDQNGHLDLEALRWEP